MIDCRSGPRMRANRNVGRNCIKTIAGVALLALTAACTSTEQVGLMALPTADPAALLTKPTAYQTLGVVEGDSCRSFALGLIPWGNGTAGAALEEALASTGGNALLNATVKTSLFGFIPIYNLFSFTCTTVRGVAIKYESPGAVIAPQVAPSS